MDGDTYGDMAEQQENHWWFKARRRILHKLIDNLRLPKSSKILEIGCGTGGNLLMLNKIGCVSAIEMDEFSINYAKNLSGVNVQRGWLPDNISCKETFDLICLFDVLEHIKDDEKSLLEIKKLLKPSGTLVITVPAYQWLYSSHDEKMRHHRRYSKSDIEKKIESVGLVVLKESHFNTILFPLVLVSRLADVLMKPKNPTGYSTPNRIINFLFYKIFSSERFLLNKMNFPYGASIIVISQKAAGQVKK